MGRPKGAKNIKRDENGNPILPETRVNVRGENRPVEYKANSGGTIMGRSKEILVQNMGIVFEWVAQEGITKREIAYRLGIPERYIYKIMEELPEFVEMLDNAKERFIDGIEKEAYKMCRDRVVEQEKVLHNGKKVTYKKVLPADASMTKFVLTNKRPDMWSEKKEVQISKKEFVIDIIDDVPYQIVEEEENGD